MRVEIERAADRQTMRCDPMFVDRHRPPQLAASRSTNAGAQMSSARRMGRSEREADAKVRGAKEKRGRSTDHDRHRPSAIDELSTVTSRVGPGSQRLQWARSTSVSLCAAAEGPRAFAIASARDGGARECRRQTGRALRRSQCVSEDYARALDRCAASEKQWRLARAEISSRSSLQSILLSKMAITIYGHGPRPRPCEFCAHTFCRQEPARLRAVGA